MNLFKRSARRHSDDHNRWENYISRDPGVLFDHHWYQTKWLGIDGTRAEAMTHYLTAGWKDGNSPSRFFQEDWYLDRYPDVLELGESALAHYVDKGAVEGRFPCAIFDPTWYLSENPDVQASGMEPYTHYIMHGEKEGRWPCEFFNPYWYLSQYPDAAHSGISALAHYINLANDDHRDPSPLFSSKWYLSAYPDIASAKMDPLHHFLVFGRNEGRSPLPPVDLNLTPYESWQDRYERSSDAVRAIARDAARRLPYKPKFSITVPTFNTPRVILIEFLESVLLQTYGNWELCIADDCSTEPHVREILSEYASKDDRIKCSFRSRNGHISEATNTAIELVTGEFICLMDHDDLISANALYEFASYLNDFPDCDMIYSDEDKITIDGKRYEPFFKPDWSPEYLESCMYTAHFACYRKTIVDQIGGFRSEFNGAQDYDFVLRFTEVATKVAHIPKVLYHWRAIPGSTAQSMDEKSYVIGAAVKALEARLQREGVDGRVVPNRYNGCFDVIRDPPCEPLVSIVIPTAGRDSVVRGASVDLLLNCIRSIYSKTSYSNFEIVVVDNGDLRAHVPEELNRIGVRRITYNEKIFNIAKKLNMGVEAALGEFVVLLNDDTEVISSNWLEAMLALAQKDKVGAVGAKLYFENRDLQHVGVAFCESLPDHVRRGASNDDPGYFFSSVASKNYMAVTGACLLVSRELYLRVGGFDESFPVNYNDVDFCLKLYRLGYRNVYAAQSQLFHYESQNRERYVDDSEINLFLDRWVEFVSDDPYYSSFFYARPPMFELRRDAFDLTE